mgnify:CR=1 FL=1
MPILNALGLKAVGLKRRIPLLSFITWLFGKSRAQKSPVNYFLLLSCILIVMYSSVRQWKPVVLFETILLDISAPVVGILQKSMISMTDLFEGMHSYQKLQQEVSRLKQQNDNLLLMNMRLKRALFLHNESLKVASLIDTFDEHFASKRRIFQTYTLNAPAFGQNLILASTKSSPFEIEKDSIVLGAKGVLGRVIQTGFRSAKVLTIFDRTSRIPVDIRGVQGIASGQGSGVLKVIHMKDTEHTLREGDIAYTSGFGGIFPKGLPLGYVSCPNNKPIEIIPFEMGTTPHVISVMEHVPVVD